jgi:hypothetical protein
VKVQTAKWWLLLGNQILYRITPSWSAHDRKCHHIWLFRVQPVDSKFLIFQPAVSRGSWEGLGARRCGKWSNTVLSLLGSVTTELLPTSGWLLSLSNKGAHTSCHDHIGRLQTSLFGGGCWVREPFDYEG